MAGALITAGLGDFIGIESWIPWTTLRKDITCIYWATRARKLIQESIDLTLVFPNLKEQHILFDDWETSDNWNNNIKQKPFCVVSKKGLQRLCAVPADAFDLSANPYMDYIQLHNFINTGSAYLMHKLADLAQFKLPDRYVVLHLYSANQYADRDLNQADINNIVAFLTKNNLTAVVLGTGKPKTPLNIDYKNIIDLTDKTSIKEAIEITKYAYMFFGCASFLSVIASKVCFHEYNPAFLVKGPIASMNTWEHSYDGIKTNWGRPVWHLYYLPQTGGEFIVQNFNDLANKEVRNSE